MNHAELAMRLKELPLFTKTESAVLAQWLTAFPPACRDVRTGERADREGERLLGVLLEGRLEIQSSDHGRSVILRELRAPGVFGAAALFCEDEAPFSSISAKTASRVLWITPDAVRALLAEDAPFREAYLAFLAGRVRFLNRKIRCFTAGSAERRLALWLVSEEGESVMLPDSMTALSDMLDIGRASLYRALDKLMAEGLILREGKKITVISQENILKKYQ